ncbi:MAG: Flp pilus assembly protein CpaB [Deltaproteobacteria bacterium]|nr:Flp pilus assembly protein CpaB [Deltaproteobacteria bacterium]
MNLSGRTSLYFAFGLALLAGLLAYSGLYSREQRLDKKWEPVIVAVAARPIKQGQVLQQEDIKFADVPRRFLLGSAVTINEFEEQHLVGQRVTIDFNTDDPILTNFIAAAQGGSGGFSDTIAPKARAVSIRVSPESSATNMVRPGDRVDVLATFRDPNGTDNLTTTLLENVWVLATGNLTGKDSFVPQSQRNFSTVTVQVLPEAAELLVLGQTLGTLYLTLRNPEDAELTDSRSIATTMKTIVSGERSKILSKQQTKSFGQTIQIIKGNKTTDVQFPEKKK